MAPYVYHGSPALTWDDYCQPAVEPEFVLMIGKDLRDEVGRDEPLDDAIEFVSPGIEIHNYRFWFGDPSMQELIASNGIHVALVVGERKVRPREIDWELEGVGLFQNERLAASGIGAEIMGGPIRSLRWLVNHLVRRGGMLRAGDLVIPGSPVELVSVGRGDRVAARFARVGRADATFE
jgi:2-keto-4-pentenoate hydratase